MFGMGIHSIDFFFILLLSLFTWVYLFECHQEKEGQGEGEEGKREGTCILEKTDALDEWRCEACLLFVVVVEWCESINQKRIEIEKKK
ncbi:hypothetical protein F5H01DRAFT_347794 [Linnemannia elongata]|nr:hypothetical protein F5H01DRAFT_347794 [Linnemannia elongata]